MHIKVSGRNNSFSFRRNAQDSLGIQHDIYKADLKKSDFNTRGIKWDFDIQNSHKNLMRFGLSYAMNTYAPDFISLSNVNSDKIYPNVLEIQDVEKAKVTEYSSNELSAYVEDEFSLSSSTKINLGVHGSHYSSGDSTYLSIQPRASLNIIGEQSWFNLSSSMLRQYQQVLSENGLGFPSDLWVLSTDKIKPADGINNSISFGFLLSKSFSINFGAYYKTMKNIIGLGEGEALILDDKGLWQKAIPKGKGTSMGGEVTFNFTSKNFNLEFNGTVSKAVRNFPLLNSGKEFLYKYDRTIMSNLYTAIKLGEKSEFSIFTTWQKGSNVTFPSGIIVKRVTDSGEQYLAPIYEAKNNRRFPDLIRIDAGFTFKTKNKLGTHKIFVGLYNILNRKNPVYLEIGRNNFDPNAFEINQISIFPVLPSLSYMLIIGK